MIFKRVPLYIALTGAFVAQGAVAQGVQIYGRLYPYVLQESGSGATALGTPVATFAQTPTGVNGVRKISGMSAGNSRLGFRGTEDLGRGLKAVFQIEGVVAVDNGNAAGFTWNRDGFVGLTGGFGSVRLGNMDTVFKEYGDTIGILGTSSGTPTSSSNIFRKASFGTSNASRFHERRANSIKYETKEMGGFQLGLQVATGENPTATIGAQKTYSMGVKYNKGPIYLALAHEIHDNFYGGSANAPAAMRNNGVGTTVGSKDTATQATVEWRPIKNHRFGFDVIRKTYDEPATVTGRFQSYSNTAYMLGMENRWSDKWRTAANYVKSGAGSCSRVAMACVTDGLEGSKFIVGASYYLSRRTYLFGMYNTITNGKSARFAANDFSVGAAINAGEDTKHLIFGISHGF